VPQSLSPNDPEFWEKIAAVLPVNEENRKLWIGAAINQLTVLGFPALSLLSHAPDVDAKAFAAWMKENFTPDYTADGEGFEG